MTDIEELRQLVASLDRQVQALGAEQDKLKRQHAALKARMTGHEKAVREDCDDTSQRLRHHVEGEECLLTRGADFLDAVVGLWSQRLKQRGGNHGDDG